MTTARDQGSPLPAQTVLQSRYRIIRLHDQGGSATVYLAERLGVEERVPLAVKELSPDVFSLAEFKNEVNVLYTLNHPNLPKVYDFFEQDGKHYLVMDFVQGRTLKQRVLEHGPLTEDQAVDYALQICDIMSYLHERAERKIIHRDLKPSNLMLTRGGQIKLLDFGIARVPEGKVPGNLMYAYTEDYASPEQRANLETDERSDIYSFGMTLLFLLTGATEGLGQTMGTASRQGAVPTGSSQVDSPPVDSPAGRGRGAVRLSAAMRRIIWRCLRRNPSERYQSFEELARDLGAYRQAKRTRVTRFLWAAASVLAVGALALAAMVVFKPSLYDVAGPDRVKAGQNVTYELALPAAWQGSLDSIVWQVFDTQSQSQSPPDQHGRYFTFSSTDLGIYQAQACVEKDGRLVPLSAVKRIEVYPGLQAPAELLTAQPVTLWAPAVTNGGGREYTWTWEVRGPETPDGAPGPVVSRLTSTDGSFVLEADEPGTYSVSLSVTVTASGGVDATITGDSAECRVVDSVVVDTERVRNANPSFEETISGRLAGWTLVYSGVSQSSSQARTGHYSLRFDGSTSGPPPYAVQLDPLAGGKTYRLTTWVKGLGVADGSMITVEAHFRSAVDETYVRPEEKASVAWSGDFEWRQIMLYFNTPPDKQMNLEIYLEFQGAGTVWFDDCMVESLD